MKEETTATTIGEVISKSIICLDAGVPEGSMYGALQYSQESKTLTWVLIYEQGGDYQGFNEGDQYNPDIVEGWMINAIDMAVREMRTLIFVEDNDLDWFCEWAEAARRTLKDA